MSKNQVRVKKRLVDELEKVPIVELACQRVGIARSTFYRWLQDDDDFANLAADALERGAELINDMAESKLIGNIKEGQFGSIVFWLKHNHPKYRPSYLSKNKRKSMWDRPPMKYVIEFIGGGPNVVR